MFVSVHKMKIYELTDKYYTKYLVKGVKNDAEARRLAKKVFGNYYWENGISYYGDVGKKYGGRTIPSMTKKQFLKYKEVY